MAEKQSFRAFCVAQVQRLGVFPKFEYVNATAQKEYRRWLEHRCDGDEGKVRRVMDEAVNLDQLPTIADMGRIWAQLFAPKAEPVITDEERQARAEHLRDWYAQEAREAQARREAASARRQPIARPPAAAPPPIMKRITEADIAAARSRK